MLFGYDFVVNIDLTDWYFSVCFLVRLVLGCVILTTLRLFRVEVFSLFISPSVSLNVVNLSFLGRCSYLPLVPLEVNSNYIRQYVFIWTGKPTHGEGTKIGKWFLLMVLWESMEMIWMGKRILVLWVYKVVTIIFEQPKWLQLKIESI